MGTKIIYLMAQEDIAEISLSHSKEKLVPAPKALKV